MLRTMRADAVEWEQNFSGSSRHKSYLGHVTRLDRGPQAFVSSRDVPGVIEPHFHPIDQFQIFVRGTDLKLGKHVCEPVAVHYTDGYTPYGPITWGEGGMAFFNLRARADTGAHWMPGSREKLARRAGRSETVHCGLADPAAAEGAEQQVLIAEHDDGLFAFGTVAGPGVELPEDVVGGAGRYELVLAGELELEDETLPAHSLLFVSAGDRLPPRRAGAGGAHVLTVQSPTN